MSDIFISYKREDKILAKSLAGKLSAMGWSVWWDNDISVGTDYDIAIEQALDSARCVIVLWSERSIQSRNVKDEANEALQRNIYIPVLIGKVRQPLGFRMIEAAIWNDNNEIEENDINNLVKHVTRLLGDPPTIESTSYVTTGNIKDKSFLEQKSVKIFVSYSSKDRDLWGIIVEGLKGHLAERGEIKYSLWTDKEIDTGSNWKKEIEKAMDGCAVAILLVSGSFAGSEFIKKNELAEFLKKKQTDNFLMLPVLVRKYNFKEFEDLSSLQFFKTYNNEYGFNKPGERDEIMPFDSIGENGTRKQLQDYYFNLAEHIHKAVSNHFK